MDLTIDVDGIVTYNGETDTDHDTTVNALIRGAIESNATVMTPLWPPSRASLLRWFQKTDCEKRRDVPVHVWR